jgi:capsid protein
MHSDSLNDSSPTTADVPMIRLRRRLAEAFGELWDNFVEPDEALWDVDGSRWSPLCSGGPLGAGSGVAYANEQQLAEIRGQCRALAVSNEYAINGHENRISYIVGSGHSYRVTAARSAGVPPALLAEVQAVLDEFVRVNKWHKRQQEIVRRKDRDGECFLRLFSAADGTTRVRFVEPGQVAAPVERATDPSASFGVQTDPADVENVLGYWIDGQLTAAAEIQHRKANVDANVKRGLPLFYPVRKNLRRAEKLLRNMSTVAEIQSAIALIRKHQAATGAALDQFVRETSDATIDRPQQAAPQHFRRYAPGTIVDATAGIDYEFPVAGIDASRFVTVLQAELRAIASRLVMPEFMLSSDASNANYSSTMVAEGPAVKMFDRLQHDMIEDDVELLWRVVAAAVAAGRLPAEALVAVDIRAVAPSLAVRDRLREAQADQILVKSGAMSIDTMSMRHGLDPQQERQLSAHGQECAPGTAAAAGDDV